MRWPFTRSDEVEQRSLLSIADPALAVMFGAGPENYTGVTVTETSALGVSALWRAVALITGTIASLPARAVDHNDDGSRDRVESWVEDPGELAGLTPFEFWETVMFHLLLHGDAFLQHIHNAAGGIIGLRPFHPSIVAIQPPTPDTPMKVYRVTMLNGKRLDFTDADMTHIPAISSDGLHGYGLLDVARNSLGISVAGDRATGRMFSNGAFKRGIITPDEDESITPDDLKAIRQSLDSEVHGWDNAGGFVAVNRKLKFTEWIMSNEDAQFLQSRQFQIEEVARWTGVPPYELMQTEKQTSWGTGIEAQQRGLSRQVIGPWTKRIEDRISRLLAPGRYLEFDFSGLERPTPEQEIELLLKQMAGGLITRDEARAIRNLGPWPEGEDEDDPSPRGEPAEDEEREDA